MSAPCNLKPCAHCGGAAKFDVDGYGNGYVICEACGAQTSGDHSPSGAFEAWNRRTQPEATKPAQDLSAAILALPLPQPVGHVEYSVPGEPMTRICAGYSSEQIRQLLKAAAALASPADALVAVDSETTKDTERLDFVLENGVPMMRNGEYRFHGFPGKWFKTDREAIDFAIQAQKDGHG